MDSEIRFASFPVVGLSTRKRSDWNIGASEISFSGKVQNCCVCFIDMIGSTRISSELSPSQLSSYYEIFLNAIALIAKNFGARIVKNAGDALIFYFEEASEPTKLAKFRNDLDCGLVMGQASNALNARMLEERLPPVRYRISADYGQVSVARSQSSQSEDLFGPAMNNSAKINSMARPNGLIIDHSLYEVVKGLDDYVFEPTELTEKGKYFGYHVDAKERKDIINPFERKASG